MARHLKITVEIDIPFDDDMLVSATRVLDAREAIMDHVPAILPFDAVKVNIRGIEVRTDDPTVVDRLHEEYGDECDDLEFGRGRYEGGNRE